MLDVRCSADARAPLAERLTLLGEVRALLSGSSLLYLLDINKETSRVAVRAAARGRPYVVDIGDEGRTLALASGLSGIRVWARQLVTRTVLRRAHAIVYRGFFHRLVLESQGVASPMIWCPDTIGDDLLDSRGCVDRDPALVATFGTVRLPDPRTDWPPYYGSELLDVLAAADHTHGLAILRGRGADAFEALAKARGLHDRIEWHRDLPLRELFQLIRRAGFVTSFQTDDLAGWSRTTGKLPLALAAGCGLLSTPVGEAYRVLPESQLFPARRTDFVAGAVARIREGWSEAEARHAQATAIQYRRSTAAARLGEFLRTMS